MLIELWRIAREAGAGFTEDRVTLTMGDISAIAGTDVRPARARRYLIDLCDSMAYQWSPGGFQLAASWPSAGHKVAVRWPRAGGTITVTIRNFGKKQGIGSAMRGDSATQEQEQEQEREQVEKSGAPKGRPPRTDLPAYAIEIAELLSGWITKTDPEAKVPTDLSAWAREADRMIRIDHRDFEQIKVAIEWLFTTNARSATPFVVLSMKALRAKYDRMRNVAKREGEGKRDGGIRDAARAVARRRGLDGGGTGETNPALRGDAGSLPRGQESGS